jgi:hypothetical protein
MTIILNGANGIITPSTTSSGDVIISDKIVHLDDTNTAIRFPAADTVTVETAGSERLRIDSSGNIGIGTSSPSFFAGANVKLVVGSAATTTTPGAITVYSGNATYGGLYFADGTIGNELFRGAVEYNHSTDALLFYSAGAERARITSSGIFMSPTTYSQTSGGAANLGVAADGAFYRSTSSLKYKRDVQDATHGLTELLALRPVTYKGKAQSDGDTVYGGLIAEEVHDAGLTEFVQYAEDGSPDALAYANMVSLCIKAIQEQQATITALTARIAALESK